jgi:hypothetical protein
MNSWSVLFLVALPGMIAVRAGVDHTDTMQPPREAWGQNNRPHAWPLDSATRHPSDFAYWIARSMCWSGCRDLVIVKILAVC